MQHTNTADRSADVAFGPRPTDHVVNPARIAGAPAAVSMPSSSQQADPLTGLPNRAVFMDRVDRLIVSCGPSAGPSFAVLFLDIDHFERVNDSLGPVAADQLLVGVARRLEQSLRANDAVARPVGAHTLARVSGDEFTVLLHGVRTTTEATIVAGRLLTAAARPFSIQGSEVAVSISIGLVMNDPRYRHAEEMVRDADTAMDHAKRRGKARIEVFDGSMLVADEERR